MGDCEGGAAGGFDQVEDLLPFLLSDNTAEHPAKESDIFTDVIGGLDRHGGFLQPWRGKTSRV